MQDGIALTPLHHQPRHQAAQALPRGAGPSRSPCAVWWRLAAPDTTRQPAAVRLAGMYAMAGLADDWKENRQTCVDVLCAYHATTHMHVILNAVVATDDLDAAKGVLIVPCTD